MDHSDITQNRRTRRSNLLMAATLEVAGRALPVKLRNLSSEGARVEGEHLPVEGSSLLFRKGDIAAEGHIVWVRGKQAGIHFTVDLDPVEVLNHIAVPRPRMAPDFRRPGLATRELSDSERKLAANWAVIPPFPPLGD